MLPTLTALVTLLPLLSSAPIQDVQDPATLFPAASGAMMVVANGAEGATMLELIEHYGDLTNQAFQLDEETRSYLSNTSTGLTVKVIVPAERVQKYFEDLLVENGFCLQIINSQEPRLLSVSSLHSGNRSMLRARALFVSEKHLAVMAQHPAILISTTLNLPNTDVRQLSNSMRTMITDANTQQLLPAGNSNSMVLTGFGGQVASLATILRKVDEASRVDPSQTAAHTKSFSRITLEHAQATETAHILNQLVNPQRSETQAQQVSSSDVRIVVDFRTNSVIVHGKPAELAQVKDLIALLDVAIK